MMGIVTLVTQIRSDESELIFFALEITESFADIYSKLSKRIFQNSSLSDVLTI
jgi:uncharacterized protein involved in type VI secretion and phage assembly